MNNERVQRLAVSKLQLEGEQMLYNQVLEIENGKVIRYYPLLAELAYTEWHPWTVVLFRDGSWQRL